MEDALVESRDYTHLWLRSTNKVLQGFIPYRILSIWVFLIGEECSTFSGPARDP